MKNLDVVVKNSAGLHARPATLLVKLAQGFKSDIFIEKDGKKANGKSIMGVLSIGAAKGDKVSIEIIGEDELEALMAVEELFNERLDK